MAEPDQLHAFHASILGRVSAADIRTDPYPHVLIDDALPIEVFDELARGFPALEYVAGDEAPLNNHACLKGSAEVLSDPSISPAWRAFFRYHLSPAFFREFAALWGDTMREVYPGLDANFGKPLAEFEVGPRASGRGAAEYNHSKDVVLDCVFGMNTPVRETSRVRDAHADSPHKMFSSLLYFRDPDDASEGGEYELYGLTHRVYPKRLRKHVPSRYLRLAKRVPYRANTLIFWLNTARSVHSVSPRALTRFPRRYVAVTGECYGGAQRDGFFGEDPQWQTAVGRARAWLNR